jgi:uncharacterized protein YbjT (DUF2867 family)
MSPKIISIVGATGNQGVSIINALIIDKSYTLRALTRNPCSDSAKALAARGVEVVQADANNVSSLTAAFEGSYAIHAITDFFEPFAKDGPEKGMEVEVQQGINLAKAAAATKSLEHYIWSTLPDAKQISGGKYVVPHFEAKNTIDRYIKSDPALLAKTTFFWITFYASNYYFPMFTPYLIPTADKYIQLQSTPASTAILSVGDVRTNVGIFVKAILANPEKTRDGTFVLAYAEETNAGDMLQTWAKAQGKKAQYVQVDAQTFNAIWPLWAKEMGVMMEFWAWAGKDRSWVAEGSKVLTRDDIGVEASSLVGVEQAFTSLKF